MTNKNRNEAAQSILQSSIKGLAEVLAVASAFFGTPIAYGWTAGWVRQFTARYYGTGFVVPVDFVWFGIVGAAIYFAARASIGTALTFAGAAFVLRFLT